MPKYQAFRTSTSHSLNGHRKSNLLLLNFFHVGPTSEQNRRLNLLLSFKPHVHSPKTLGSPFSSLSLYIYPPTKSQSQYQRIQFTSPLYYFLALLLPKARNQKLRKTQTSQRKKKKTKNQKPKTKSHYLLSSPLSYWHYHG